MNILVCGASGFIGSALCAALAAGGHTVRRGVRTPALADEVAIDFAVDQTVADWLPRLSGVDVVVNAVGILVESRGHRFAAIHVGAPVALFKACVAAGVKRVVQLSALGAASGNTPYFRSKRAADQALMALPIDWIIVRPGLVYGDGGKSAAMFRAIASFPLLVLPGYGQQPLQPLHIDDLAALLARTVEATSPAQRCIDAVGPHAMSYRQMLTQYRQGLGFPPGPTIAIPRLVMAVVTRGLSRLAPQSPLNADSWAMLQAGCVGDASIIEAELGRPLIAFPGRQSTGQIAAQRAAALAVWRPWMSRLTLALIWISTGLISAFVFPQDESLRLLAPLGLAGWPAMLALYGAATLDLVLGVATLKTPGVRLWWWQIALVSGYSLIIALTLPEYLLHPFGPVTKNLAVIALLLNLLSEERNS